MDVYDDKLALQVRIACMLHAARFEANLTQRELAAKAGINPFTYKGYENCRSNVPMVHLVRIADVLDVSVDYLLGRV